MIFRLLGLGFMFWRRESMKCKLKTDGGLGFNVVREIHQHRSRNNLTSICNSKAVSPIVPHFSLPISTFSSFSSFLSPDFVEFTIFFIPFHTNNLLISWKWLCIQCMQQLISQNLTNYDSYSWNFIKVYKKVSSFI